MQDINKQCMITLSYGILSNKIMYRSLLIHEICYREKIGYIRKTFLHFLLLS